MKPAQLSDRWPELDGVRGLAALLVVYAHLFLMWIPAGSGAAFWLRSVSGLAWTGVYLFFVLSGFLIGGVLLQQREAPNYFSVFYTRRALRILPVYFTLLGVYLVLRLTPGLADAPGFAPTRIPLWNYLLLVQNFPMGLTGDWGAAALGPTWSVALEEQFYLFLPWCIRFVPPRAHLPLFLSLAAVGPVFRAFAPLAYSPFILPGSIEALFAGAMLAWAHRQRPQLFRSARCRMAAGAGMAAGGAGMMLMLVHTRLGVWNITAITLFWSGFLWLVLSAMGTRWTALLRSRPLCGLGFISYGVYLFHSLVYQTLFIWLTGAGPRHEAGQLGLAIAGASLALVVLAASLSYWLLERRLMAYGRTFRYAPAPPLAARLVVPGSATAWARSAGRRLWVKVAARLRPRVHLPVGGRFARLDVLRGLAIVLVVAFHCSLLLTPLRGAAAAREWAHDFAAALPGWLAPLSEYVVLPVTHGRYGVTLFFLISGYCIHVAFLRWRERNRVAAPRAFAGIFVWRRFWRIYPPMLVALILGWLLAYGDRLWIPPVLRHLGASLLMARNFSPGSMLVMNGALWSVNIEWQLYLLFPVLLILAGGRRWLLPVGLAGVVVSWLWVFGVPGWTDSDWFRHLPVLWWGEWLLGVILAELHARGRALFPHAGACTAGLGVLAAWCVLRMPGSQLEWFLARLAFAALLEWAVVTGRPLSLLERGAAAIGVRSYSIYLFHLPVMTGVAAMLALGGWRWTDPAAWLMGLPVYLALTYAVGALSQRWLEQGSVATGERLNGWWTRRRVAASAMRPPAPAVTAGAVRRILPVPVRPTH
jgi:peptidoglycan/LPS O-acetylase OafA/YrhL